MGLLIYYCKLVLIAWNPIPNVMEVYLYRYVTFFFFFFALRSFILLMEGDAKHCMVNYTIPLGCSCLCGVIYLYMWK